MRKNPTQGWGAIFIVSFIVTILVMVIIGRFIPDHVEVYIQSGLFAILLVLGVAYKEHLGALVKLVRARPTLRSVVVSLTTILAVWVGSDITIGPFWLRMVMGVAFGSAIYWALLKTLKE